MTEPVPMDGVTPTAATVPSPYFAGNFDLYSMNLSFLSEVYVNEDGPPRFEELYEKILTFQADDDNTAMIYIAPPNSDKNDSKYICLPMEDPTSGLPYNITVRSVAHHDQLDIPAVKFPSGVPSDHCGISARLNTVKDSRGIAASSGTLHMRRIWTKEVQDGELVELFEGELSFMTIFTSPYRLKGHGPGQKFRFSFWAVRARADEKGNEVGLKEGVKKTPVFLQADEPPRHPAATENPKPISLEEPVPVFTADLDDDEILYERLGGPMGFGGLTCHHGFYRPQAYAYLDSNYY